MAFGARKILDLWWFNLAKLETSWNESFSFLFILFLHGKLYRQTAQWMKLSFPMGGGPGYGSHGSILSVDAVQVRFIQFDWYRWMWNLCSPCESLHDSVDLRSEQKRITCCGNALSSCHQKESLGSSLCLQLDFHKVKGLKEVTRCWHSLDPIGSNTFYSMYFF